LSSATKKQIIRKRRRANRRGVIAEKIAELLLRLKGYRIVERRYKKPVGEIDLIVFKNNTIIAVEVKIRKDLDKALHAVGHIQQRRIRRTMELFLANNSRYSACDVRLDLVLVTSFFQKPLHMENAW